jgi:hypothetical protein
MRRSLLLETLPLVGLCATGAPIVQHVNNE